MPTIKIKGMSCQHCVASVTRALSEVNNVTDVQVNLETAEATFNQQGDVDPELIEDSIRKIGFEVV